MRNIITKITNNFTKSRDLVLTTLINQIILYHIRKKNKYKNLEQFQHPKQKFSIKKAKKTQSYQPTQMHNEISLPYYLEQHERTKSQLTNFSQMLNAAESLQITMNPYLMGGSSVSSNKTLIVFTCADPGYSVEDCPNAVTANLILNIGPEPVNTPLHQN